MSVVQQSSFWQKLEPNENHSKYFRSSTHRLYFTFKSQRRKPIILPETLCFKVIIVNMKLVYWLISMWRHHKIHRNDGKCAHNDGRIRRIWERKRKQLPLHQLMGTKMEYSFFFRRFNALSSEFAFYVLPFRFCWLRWNKPLLTHFTRWML